MTRRELATQLEPVNTVVRSQARRTPHTADSFGSRWNRESETESTQAARSPIPYHGWMEHDDAARRVEHQRRWCKGLKHFSKVLLGEWPTWIGIGAALALAWVLIDPTGGGFRGAAILIEVGLAVVATLVCVAIPRTAWLGIVERHFVWIPAAFGFLSFFFWHWYAAGHGIDLSFFDVGAHVLAIIALAAVVDVRRSNRLRTAHLVPSLLIIVVGEVAALSVTSGTDASNPYNFAIVCASFVTAGVALMLLLLADVNEVAALQSSDQ